MRELRERSEPRRSRVLRHMGDRIGGFAVLLPAEPGTVLLAVSEAVAAALQPHFPDAVVLGAGPARLPAPGSVGLLVVDTRLMAAAPLLPALAADGVLATIGGRGRYLVYPEVERPQQVWRRGWPVPEVVGLRAQARRTAGIRSAAVRGVPRLDLRDASFASLADLVGRDLGRALGEPVRLVGITTAGHTTLRFRGRRDLAVRLSTRDSAADVLPSATVAREVPAASGLVPEEVARGRTCGRPWAATPWVPQPPARPLHAWARARDSWTAAARLATALESVVTGRTAPGWGRAWLAASELVPADLAAAFEGSLERLDRGLPTGWCHGDPWPGNILTDGTTATVIDWDNAARDAPLGLDRVLIEALRIVATGRATMAQACTRLVQHPGLVPYDVGGRPWASWDPPTRTALGLAAFLLHLRNRALPDLGEAELAADLETMLALVAAPEPLDRPDADDDRSGAARGAIWLGLGATVVKASQTAVLLVLATLLAPSAMGLLAIGSLVVNVTSAVTDLGSSTALVYWRGDAERAARSALTIAIGLGFALTGIGWLVAPWLADALNAGPDGSGVIRGLMLSLPCYGIAGVSRELLRRDMAFGRRVLPDIVAAVIGAAVALVLAFEGHGVYSLVVGQVVQAALAMALCWLMRAPVRPGWSRPDVSGLVAYGRHLAGANIVQFLMLNVDYLLVARLLGPGPLGQYSIAFRLAYMPYLLVAVVIGGAAFPYLCRLRGGAVGGAASQVVAVTLTLLVPMYAGIVLLAPQLELLGSQWAPAEPALRWLAGYGLVLSMVQLCLVPLNAVSRTRDTFWLTLLHLCLLGGILLATTRQGITVVAVGQLVAVLVVALASGLLVGRHVPGFDWPSVVRRLVPAAVGALSMVVVVRIAQHALPWSRVSATGLVLVGGLALLAYAVPVWLLGRDRLIAAAVRETS